MDKKSLIYIGKSLRTHNIKGEIIIKNENINIDINNVDVFFVDIDSCLVPFYINSIKYRDTKSLIVSFDKIDSPQDAAFLIDKDYYVFKKYTKNNISTSNLFLEIEGYNVIDTELGNIGIVIDILDIPGNTLLKVLFNEKEILIPLAEDIIIEINHNKKNILVKTPSGLIDLYL